MNRFRFLKTRPLAHLLGVLVASTLFALEPAQASPWVLDQGVTVIGVKAGTDFARREFLPNHHEQAYPLDGRFQAYTLEIGARYGLIDRLEVSGRLLAKSVVYQSAPVILSAPADDSLSGYRAAIFDFSNKKSGLSDLYLNANYQHIKTQTRLSSGLQVKIPLGYTAPKATFKNDSPSPSGIKDDVALGDGQVDLQYSLEFGHYFVATNTAVEIDAGYKHRFGDPGDQVVAEIKIGEQIGSHFFVFASCDGAYTVFNGRVLGQTFTSTNPGRSALDFDASELKPFPYRLDTDFARANLGVIIKANEREWIVRASQVLWGKQYAKLTSIEVGVLLPFR